jgi:hypothetical protein
MVSYINRLAFDFERNHGCRPNILYLNPEQLTQLRSEFDGCMDIKAIAELLAMEIMVNRDTLHPTVARIPTVGEIRQAG